MSWLKQPNLLSSSGSKKPAKVLLVTAHPDDEVMFFTPLLTSLCIAGYHVSILCLSDGNFEGLGNIRSNELIKCAAMFHIANRDVYIINHPSLLDGMKNDWPPSVVAEIVQQHIRSIGPTMVFTFDERGVSDHPNHIATFQGVKLALTMLTKHPDSLNVPLGLKLKSNHICRKFCGMLDILLEYWLSEYLVVSFGLLTALKGMYIHRSQNQFYRQVFVLLSTFTYVNSFVPIL